jgi:hypothetical protein
MRPERLPALVTIKERRENFERQSGSHEKLAALERRENQFAHLTGRRVVFGQLHVVFRPCGLVPGRNSSINPFGLLQYLSALCQFIDRQ